MIQWGVNALMHACKNGHLAIVQYLVLKCAATDVQDKVRNWCGYVVVVVAVVLHYIYLDNRI